MTTVTEDNFCKIMILHLKEVIREYGLLNDTQLKEYINEIFELEEVSKKRFYNNIEDMKKIVFTAIQEWSDGIDNQTTE